MGSRRSHHGLSRRAARRAALAAVGVAAAAVGGARAASLTPTETLWLDHATPVLRHAMQQRLPLDIVVQPTARPGDPPLALGFQDGRCKLVLSMRGNPSAQATLDALEPALVGPAVEAMTAHELAHCWRYVQGAWHTLPAGFASRPERAAASGPAVEMELTRREEGYADLVGLAWTARENRGAYAAVQRWLLELREREPTSGSHHDTREWVRLARDPSVFAPAGATLFEQALPLWREGLGQAPD